MPATDDLLTEHTVLVAQPVPHCRNLPRGERIEETGRETSEPAVAESGVRLLLDQLDPVEVNVPQHPLGLWLQQQVCHVVSELAPDQKFHRQVIDALGVKRCVSLLRAQPALAQQVSNRAGECFKALPRTQSLRRGHSVELQVAFVVRGMLFGERDAHDVAAMKLFYVVI